MNREVPGESSAPPSGEATPGPVHDLSPVESWQAAFDALAEPIWLMDTEYRILRCNRAAREFYGGEIIGRRCWEVAHGSPGPVPECPVPQLNGSGHREATELLVGKRWYSCTVDPLFNAAGKISGALRVLRDITPQKLAEKMLREANELLEQRVVERTVELQAANRLLNHSEENLRQLIENAPVAIAMFDRDMRYLAASRRWLADYGLAGQDVVGRSHYDVFPEISAHWKACHRRALAGEVLQQADDRFQRADGSVQWLKWELRPWRNSAGTVGGIIIFTEDITGQKEGEVALKSSETALKQAQRLAAVGSWDWDVASGRHGWSEEIYRIYGRDPALPPAVYPEVKRYFTPESWKRLSAAVEQAVAEGTAYECDAEVVRADGSRCWITARGQAICDAGGKVIRLHGTVQDITERKRSEQLLHRANRTLQAIRDCHEVMLRVTTERSLLEEVCRIIVKTGGERMAWVGFAGATAEKAVRPVAAAGFRKDYLKQARISWADTPRGRGPVGTAIRTGQVCRCDNTLTDPNFAPWRESARRHGYGSAISLPLVVDGQCIGALSIYANEPGAFDAGEQLLLTDLANDLAFGMNTLRLRAERERLENEILKSIEREQERIGRDLHDGLCQLLVGAKFRSVYLAKITKDRVPSAGREAAAIEETLNQAIEQTRDLARGLNPVNIAPEGLAAALQKLADGVRGPRCFCQFPEPVQVFDHHAASNLYRIAQEAVQNALKHAGAKNISITLTRRENRIVLTVKDDGAGLPRRLKKSGMGLNNMQTRAQLIGARLEIRRRQHGGTAVTCELAGRPERPR